MRLLFAVLVASGCTLDMTEPSVGSVEQNVESHNRLATNRLATNRLATNRLATNRLATNSLNSTRLEALAETAEILGTPGGREVYSYLISCALPPGVTIGRDDVVNTDCQDVAGCEVGAPANDAYCTDGSCTFGGDLGLAPEWQDRKLGVAGQGWVSACIFARVNKFETAEGISLRGRVESLAPVGSEADIYTLQEGAFYGDLFRPVDEPIGWYACRGESQAAEETGGLVLRDCAEEDPDNPGFTYCGFNYAGDCADFTPAVPSPYACRTYEAGTGVYGGCHEASGDGRWGGLERFRQVITVYVSP